MPRDDAPHQQHRVSPVKEPKVLGPDATVSAVNRYGNNIPLDAYSPSQTGDANTNPKVYIIENIPTPKRSHRDKLIPIVILQINIINGVKLPRPFLCLLDSRSTGCLINRKSMPFVSKTIRTKHATVSTITQYTYSCDEVVFLEDIQIMEFTNAR